MTLAYDSRSALIVRDRSEVKRISIHVLAYGLDQAQSASRRQHVEAFVADAVHRLLDP